MASQVICRCCRAETMPIFSGALIGKSIFYFECNKCGYVQTEDPYWLDQAYSNVINDSDTGIMARNQQNARITLATMFLINKLNGSLVDCAGGYGILVRLLRDFGVDAKWSDRFCQNILAKGFEYSNGGADLVTAFEAFEHFLDPSDELDRILQIAPNVLLSTDLIASPAPRQEDWWYYGKEHGQHIGFFRKKTLEKLAQDRGMHLTSNGSTYHLITKEPVNKSAWLMMVRFNKLMPMLLSRHLKTKMWEDHKLIVNRNL